MGLGALQGRTFLLHLAKLCDRASSSIGFRGHTTNALDVTTDVNRPEFIIPTNDSPRQASNGRYCIAFSEIGQAIPLIFFTLIAVCSGFRGGTDFRDMKKFWK